MDLHERRSISVQGKEREQISWSMIEEGDGSLIKIGEQLADRTTFNLGVLRFLGGERMMNIGIGGQQGLRIPDSTDGTVYLGRSELSYEDFVDGVIWSLGQPGILSQTFQRPWLISQRVALESLREKLKRDLPERNEDILKIAQEMRDNIEYFRSLERRSAVRSYLPASS